MKTSVMHRSAWQWRQPIVYHQHHVIISANQPMAINAMAGVAKREMAAAAGLNQPAGGNAAGESVMKAAWLWRQWRK